MNAPDKIYLAESDNIKGEVISNFASSAPFRIHDSIAYIRKDALLEWLRNEYETISWYYEKMKHVTGCIGDTGSSGKAEAYEKVINKIESL